MSLLKKNLYSIKLYQQFYQSRSVARPEPERVFCNSGMPLNAHYSVFRSWYYLTIFTQHTLKGNLYHKLRNTFWLCSGLEIMVAR